MTITRIAAAATALVAIALAVPHTGETRVASPRESLLVTSDWLAAHLNDPDLVLLHVGDRKEYDAAHIPGARFASQRDVSVSSDDHEHGLMLEMASPDSLRKQLEKLGISDNSRIVVYYGSDWVSPTTRIIFTLDYAGLGDRVSLLDGGMQDWIAKGHPTSTAAPAARTGSLSTLKVKPIVVDAKYVLTHLRSPNVAIVDGRDASFYDGVQATADRKGHIPGAHSVPFVEIADDKNYIRSTEQLAKLFRDAGVQPTDTVVGYCHIGQQATAMLFAARLTGHPVKLYDGSMQEWSRSGFPLEGPSGQ